VVRYFRTNFFVGEVLTLFSF